MRQRQQCRWDSGCQGCSWSRHPPTGPWPCPLQGWPCRLALQVGRQQRQVCEGCESRSHQQWNSFSVFGCTHRRVAHTGRAVWFIGCCTTGTASLCAHQSEVATSAQALCLSSQCWNAHRRCSTLHCKWSRKPQTSRRSWHRTRLWGPALVRCMRWQSSPCPWFCPICRSCPLLLARGVAAWRCRQREAHWHAGHWPTELLYLYQQTDVGRRVEAAVAAVSWQGSDLDVSYRDKKANAAAERLSSTHAGLKPKQSSKPTPALT